MRAPRYLLALCILLGGLVSAQVTPNLGLNIPPFGLQNWNIPVNANFTKLDTLLACFGNVTNAGSLFYYNGTSWVCLAGNTSGTQVLQETSSGVPSWATVSALGGGTTINPTNTVIPYRSNSTTFADSHLVDNGTTLAVQGISFTDPLVTNVGTTGSTFYIYCVVATDSYGSTRSTCFNTATGNATLNGTNYNVITVAAYTTGYPFLSPVGSCNVYRTVSSGTPSSTGKIGTIASCAAGGSLNDQGLAGDSTTPPVDTSGQLTTTGAVIVGSQSGISAGVLFESDQSNLVAEVNTPLMPGYTHSVIFGQGNPGAIANSGITAVGWSLSGNAHACTQIGYGTVCNGPSGFAAGIGASVTGDSAVAVGSQSTASSGVAVGAGATASAGNVVAIGFSATAGNTNSIAIGKNATTTAVNQFVAGGPNITDLYAGAVPGTAKDHSLSYQISSILTVATLPACNAGNEGTFSAVSDATAPTYNATLTGSGAIHIPVYCNGTAWTAH